MTSYNPFINEYFIGFVNQVTPQGVKIHFPSSSLLQPFFRYGELHHGGLVGNYVVIEGHQMGFLGKIQSLELPEKERLELSAKSFETNEMHPVGYVEILLSFSFDQPEKIQRGLNSLPPIGSKVFVCASNFIQGFFRRFGTNKENKEPCLMNLGVLTQDQETPVEISLDALFGRHCAIVGTTGGGKSYTTSKLLEGIHLAGSKAIILDPTGEYSGYDNKEYTEAAILNKDSYLHYTRLSVSDWFALFRPAGQVQQPKLLDAIRSLKLAKCIENYETVTSEGHYCNSKEKGEFIILKNGVIIKSGSYKNAYRHFEAKYNSLIEDNEISIFEFTKLIDQIKEECAYDNVPQWGNADKKALENVSSLIIRIYNKISSHSFKLIFGIGKDETKDLCSKIEYFLKDPSKHIFRIGFEGVPYEFQTREILANAIAKFLLNKARNREFKDHPLVLFVDEAHQFLNKEVKDEYFQATQLDSFDSIAKECRKYGLFLCLSTQMPRDIPLGTLSQMGTFIVHRLINYKDKEAVESACSAANKSTLAYLPVLGAGEAILMGVDFPMPVMLKVNMPLIEPESHTPPFKKQ
jgi:Predicted ATPase